MAENTALKTPNIEYARQIVYALPQATYAQACQIYHLLLNDPGVDDYVFAQVGLHDRFFLLTRLLNRMDADDPWLYERCREVEATPDDCLDLWAREHYKSTIITYAGSIQEMARDPEITIGIFSHTRPIAKGFLVQIKEEAQNNPYLSKLYPDTFWADPQRESPRWSLDGGLVFKRRSNPKEATIEAWGLVDGQPTSKHFKLMIYDDVVTRESVYTPEMIVKTTDAWELSRNLSAKSYLSDGRETRRTWMIGTRYSYADTYQVILDRGAVTPRIHPATHDGRMDGTPVFLSQEDWDKKRKESSEATIACQQLQNPLAGSQQEFKMEWLRRYEIRPLTLNIAILVDPANSKRKSSCNTAMAVIGMDANFNKYLLDGCCHRLSLTERWIMLKGLRNKWVRQPGIQSVRIGYEKYGMQADIDHFKEMMRIEEINFEIEEVNWPRDRQEGAKDDRIRRLIPDFQNWRFFLPYDGPETDLQARTVAAGEKYLLAKKILRRNEDKKLYDVAKWFIDTEYKFFPATTWKDLMDAMSRFYDLDICPPLIVPEGACLPPADYARDS